MKDLKRQLEQLSTVIPPPDSERVDFLRERLISRIRFEKFNQKPQNIYILTFREFVGILLHPWQIVQSIGAVTVSLILIMVLGLGGVVVQASGPGDLLYPLKISVETMPLVLPASIMSKEAKAIKVVQIAQNRQKEIVTIIHSQDNDQAKAKKIQQVAIELSKNIESAQKRVREISLESENKVVVEVASSVKDSVSEIKKSLDEVARQVVRDELDSNTSEELKKVSQQVSQAELSTLGVLIAVVKPDSNSPGTSLKETPQDSLIIPEDEDLPLAIQDKPVNQVAEKSTSEKMVARSQEEVGAALIIDGSPAGGTGEAGILDLTNQPVAGVEEVLVKEQIVEGLKSLIREIEISLSSDEGPTVTPTGEEIISTNRGDGEKIIEQPAGELDQVEQRAADSFEEGGKALNAKEEKVSGEVVLNVEELIEQEVKQRQSAERQARLRDLIEAAKEALAEGNYTEALTNIQAARVLIDQ